MLIGIVGYGFVGKALAAAFDTTNFVVVDPAIEDSMTIAEMLSLQPDAIFVCVPTPSRPDGSVDHRIVRQVIIDIRDASDEPQLVIVKSTITPEHLKALSLTKNIRLVYNPEFLTAAKSVQDFLESKFILLAGKKDDIVDVKLIYAESKLKGVEIIETDYFSASMMKYAINSFLALKVGFMNQLYEIMEPTEWARVAELLKLDPRIGETHLQVPGPDGQRGFGGMCFPKDTKALIAYAQKRQGDLTLLKKLLEYNSEIRK